MEWEFRFLNYIQRNIRSDILDFIMPLISYLGALGAVWIVIAVISMLTKKYREFGISLSFDLIISLIPCNLIFKPIVHRLRPYVMNNTITLIVPPEIDPSFPSGHTFFAFSAATICFIYNKKFGCLMYILAALIGFSRLYLYIHFPTDVFFGAVFGILTAIGAYYLEKTIFKSDKIIKEH